MHARFEYWLRCCRGVRLTVRGVPDTACVQCNMRMAQSRRAADLPRGLPRALLRHAPSCLPHSAPAAHSRSCDDFAGGLETLSSYLEAAETRQPARGGTVAARQTTREVAPPSRWRGTSPSDIGRWQSLSRHRVSPVIVAPYTESHDSRLTRNPRTVSIDACS